MFRQFINILRKKQPGMMGIDVALSPWLVLLELLGCYIIVMLFYLGFVLLIFVAVDIESARYAALDSNLINVEQKIEGQMTRIFPQQSDGITLFSPSDIMINQYDGPYVTTDITYRIMLPGAPFFEKMGISPSQLVVPVHVPLSFIREF